jgi:hypothetical protein
MKVLVKDQRVYHLPYYDSRHGSCITVHANLQPCTGLWAVGISLHEGVKSTIQVRLPGVPSLMCSTSQDNLLQTLLMYLNDGFDGESETSFQII